MNLITIKNLKFSYDDTIIFSNLNMDIKKNKFTVILGLNGTGKSTLCKILNGTLSYHGQIHFENEIISSNNHNFSKNIALIDENVVLKQNTVIETLWCGYTSSFKNFKEEINQLNYYFNIKDILYKKVHMLKKNEQNLIYILSKIISHPYVIILDEPFPYLNKEEKYKILHYLVKDKNQNIIFFTRDIEDIFLSDEIQVLSNKQIVLSTNIHELSKYEKVLYQNGFSLPFSIDLSKKLSYYNLLDDEIQDIDEMVDILWK